MRLFILLVSIVLFPLWYFWPKRCRPTEVAWVDQAFLSAPAVFVLLLLGATYLALACKGLPMPPGASDFAGLLWLFFGLLFVLRTLLYLERAPAPA